MSGRTPVPGSALHRHPHRVTTDHARLSLSVLPSGQTQVQGLPKHRFRSSQLMPNLHLQRRGARLSDCRGTGWLSYMFKYLPHRRWLCDEPNQAHPPAAPAALERKHPVDARQQLCPQISRRVSCPRCAKICALCLWPGCLAPRPQLPASICRHQRPPRRVRCQHPEVAVPMLGRRWYQCRNPIQKLTCA